MSRRSARAITLGLHGPLRPPPAPKTSIQSAVPAAVRADRSIRGEMFRGVRGLPPSTDTVWMLGRVLATDNADLVKAKALAAAIRMTPAQRVSQ